MTLQTVPIALLASSYDGP